MQHQRFLLKHLSWNSSASVSIEHTLFQIRDLCRNAAVTAHIFNQWLAGSSLTNGLELKIRPWLFIGNNKRKDQMFQLHFGLNRGSCHWLEYTSVAGARLCSVISRLQGQRLVDAESLYAGLTTVTFWTWDNIALWTSKAIIVVWQHCTQAT